MKTEVKNLEDILIYHKINYYRIASLHYELKKHFSLYEKLSMIVTICNKNNGGLLLNKSQIIWSAWKWSIETTEKDQEISEI